MFVNLVTCHYRDLLDQLFHFLLNKEEKFNSFELNIRNERLITI